MFSLLLLAGYAQDTSFDFTGKWEDKKLNMIYEFNPDGSIMFYQSGNGVLISSYTLDTSYEPAWIDFTIKQGSMMMEIYGLLKIVDAETIWIEQFGPAGDHPTVFSDPEGDGKYKIHVLKKVVEN